MTTLVGIAFAIGYIGDAFHGSQVQPEVRTVQKDLQFALKKAKFAGPNPIFKLASRTDAGVNARMNIGFCKIPKNAWLSMKEAGFCRAINDNLSDAIILAAEETSLDFNPRFALRRTYKYRLESMRPFVNDYDEIKVIQAMKLFEGTHDFTGFSRPEDRNPVRTIEWCKPWKIDGRLVGFEVAARSFLWNQIRRIAWTLANVAQGNCTLSEISESLAKGQKPPSYGLGSARWLTLWEITYDNLSIEQKIPELFESITKPPNNLDERKYELWCEITQLEQKKLMIESWIDYI